MIKRFSTVRERLTRLRGKLEKLGRIRSDFSFTREIRIPRSRRAARDDRLDARSSHSLFTHGSSWLPFAPRRDGELASRFREPETIRISRRTLRRAHKRFTHRRAGTHTVRHVTEVPFPFISAQFYRVESETRRLPPAGSRVPSLTQFHYDYKPKGTRTGLSFC